MTSCLKHAQVAFVGLAIALIILAGCAAPGRRLESPRITLADIQLQELTLFETVFQIELRILNTNDASFEIKGVDCKLKLNGKKFATGVSDTHVTIPPFSTVRIPMVLYSSVVDIVKGLKGFQDTEDMEYEVSGRLHVSGGFLVPSVLPFKSEGKISLKEMSGAKEKT
jgi:LEA14-like dessication related protein